MRTETLEIRGIRLAVRHAAGSTPFVLLPGLGLSGRYLEPMLVALGGEFDAWASDPVGFGARARPRRVLDIETHGEVLASWLDVCGIDRAVVFGNSFGSQLAVELALQAPERVAAVVLGAPTPVAEHRSYAMHVARLLEAGWRAPNDLRRIAFADYRSAGLRRIAVTGHYAIRDPIKEKLARLEQPALVLHGESDPVARERWAHEVAARLPHGSLVELGGAAHGAVFAEPDEVARIVVPFARRLGAV